MNKFVVICDIDNCFADSREWFKIVPPANDDREGWDNYLEHDDLCTANKQVVDLVCATAEILPVFFLTGREDRKNNRKNTMQQIKEYSRGIIDLEAPLTEHRLYMRSEFDYRPSDVVKEEMLVEMVKNGLMPIVAIDDEERNCAMFKKYNIPTVLYDINEQKFIKYHGATEVVIQHD